MVSSCCIISSIKIEAIAMKFAIASILLSLLGIRIRMLVLV